VDIELYFETITDLPVDWEKLQWKSGEKRIIGFSKKVNGKWHSGNTGYFVPTTEQSQFINQLEVGDSLTFIYLHTNYPRMRAYRKCFSLDGLYKVICQRNNSILYLNEFIESILVNGINFIIE
jgi:hypothetical protein